ncbi:hypothetical protein DI270_030755 [Microbispora triticiradicis]|uniref:Uncharacterized protein n=1 Tax=Microbispora triticiradicis TaxID=2200763 RepID=A0ABX9LC59_9ACTN|nr:hypothetical protein DI270_030755 [Microbispora triticiradicis]
MTVQRKRADVRQFLTVNDGLADDSLAEATSFPSDRYLLGSLRSGKFKIVKAPSIAAWAPAESGRTWM